MTIEETYQVLEILECTYPALNFKDKRATAVLWHKIWANYELDDVWSAINKFQAGNMGNGFPPDAGQIVQLIADEKIPMRPFDVIWSEIQGAVAIYGYASKFENLAPDAKRIVSSPRYLYEWALSYQSLENGRRQCFATYKQLTDERARMIASGNFTPAGESIERPETFKTIEGGITDDAPPLPSYEVEEMSDTERVEHISKFYPDWDTALDNVTDKDRAHLAEMRATYREYNPVPPENARWQYCRALLREEMAKYLGFADY